MKGESGTEANGWWGTGCDLLLNPSTRGGTGADDRNQLKVRL